MLESLDPCSRGHAALRHGASVIGPRVEDMPQVLRLRRMQSARNRYVLRREPSSQGVFGQTSCLTLCRIHSNRRRASIELRSSIIGRLIFPQLTDKEGGRSGPLALHKMGD
jgi:hypothetical protein